MPILEPRHDFGHDVAASPDWSESYYFNAYDPAVDTGFFARFAIRPNEPHVDGFISLWLPDGSSARLAESRAERVPDPGTPMLDRLGCERLTPMQTWRLTGAGVSDEGREVQMSATFEALIPPIGVDVSTRAQHDSAGSAVVSSMGSGHFEQSGRWYGEAVVDGRRYTFAGRGNRDKSWGPRRTVGDTGMRYWRWFSMNFDDDLHLGGIRIGTATDAMQRGWLYRNGDFVSLREMNVRTELAADGLTQHRVWLEARDRHGVRHDFEGEVLRTLPLLARGHQHMKIIEALTRWEHQGRTGYGICEYAHHLDAAGRPEVPIL